MAKSGMYIGSCKLDNEEPYWVCAADGETVSFASASGAGKKAGATKAKKKKKQDSDDEDNDSCYGDSDEDDSSSSSPPADLSSGPKMEYRKVRITPGLYKLFDEILVNAADNKQRDKGKIIMDSE